MRKFVVFSILCMGILGATAPCPAAAAETYDDMVKNFSVNGLGKDGKVIGFGTSSSNVYNLMASVCGTGSSRNNAALQAFEQKVCKGVCSDGQCKNISYSDINKYILITCNISPTDIVDMDDYTEIFLEAHCAGFCARDGDTFSRFDYDKRDCYCTKRGSVRSEGVQLPPAAAPAKSTFKSELSEEPVSIDDDLEIKDAKVKKEKAQKEKKQKAATPSVTSQEQNQKTEETTTETTTPTKTGTTTSTDNADIAAATETFKKDMETLRQAFIKKIEELQKNEKK